MRVCPCAAGWALCGHEAAPGTAATLDTGEAADSTADIKAAHSSSGTTAGDPDATAAHTRESRLGADTIKPAASCMHSASAGQKAVQGCQGSCDEGVMASCTHVPTQQQLQHGRLQGCVPKGAELEDMGKKDNEQQGNAPLAAWHPSQLLDHQQRIQLGMKCKQLIDAGRCAWMQDSLACLMQQQGEQPQHAAAGSSVPQRNSNESNKAAGASGDSGTFVVQRVAYIDESVTGENTLLVLGRRQQSTCL